jgi:hypothetical protein
MFKPSSSFTLAASLMFCAAAALSASDDKLDRATLRGLRTVCTVVEILGAPEGFTVSKNSLAFEIEGRLTAAGIPVDRNATTCLYLKIQQLPAIGRAGLPIGKGSSKQIGLYAVAFDLEFLQAVTLARDPSAKAYATTWSVSNLATVPTEELSATVRQAAVDLVDQFVRAFKEANQK